MRRRGACESTVRRGRREGRREGEPGKAENEERERKA